ncbi:MAG: hypothetical protein GC191_06750 [Azospirillum sp.]|nr:hypothetical protein [Azospirillum sp.]
MRPLGWLWSAVVALLVIAADAGAASGAPEPPIPWMVYYADKEPAASFLRYDLVVFDSDHHPALRPLLERGKRLLGYLSVGEVENHRDWFEAVKSQGLLLEENPNWPGSFAIDLRDRRWTALVIEELVPRLLQAGFEGVFLDTLDIPPDLERRDPAAYAGMTQAAVHLVKAIRLNYPTLPIMMNRAYELLPEVGGDIDYALGESVYATWDFAASAARLADPVDYRRQVAWLSEARQRFPGLKVMTLDYWDPADAAGLSQIYAVERANGFSPCVSVIALDRVIPEPPR